MNQWQSIRTGEGLLKNYYGTNSNALEIALEKLRKKRRKTRLGIDQESLDMKDGSIQNQY